MSNKQIYWTPIAIDSLQETTEFVLKIWNSNVVEILLELVDARLEQIKSNPEIAPKILKTDFRRIIIHKHVSLFYIIETNQIKNPINLGQQTKSR
ncbi:MAG: type II toxin-antitoxin system RelE/ParE family toxin [Chitinophagales bacterium]